jgi:hypothetical protein
MRLCVSGARRQREAGQRDGVEAVHRNDDEACNDTRQERFLSHSFVPFSSLHTSSANVNVRTPRKFISTIAEVMTPIFRSAQPAFTPCIEAYWMAP